MAAPAPNVPELAAVLQALATAITNMTNAGNFGGGGAAAAAQLDPAFEAAPFDLSSRAGAAAYARACLKLDEVWDGTVHKFPSFVIALRLRSSEANWDTASPQGIIRIQDPVDANKSYNLLTEYHQISEAAILAAETNRTDNRAKQNATAMYRTLKQSLDGDIKATMFHQIDNLQPSEDGVALFYRLTKLTAVASLQLSMLSFRKIMEFNPADFNFNITTINTQLNQLFVLSTTSQRQLANAERIEYVLQVYDRIKRPDQWAHWVINQFSLVREGNIPNCQAFMNAAVIQYNEITNRQEGKFGGSSLSIEKEMEDIVALVAKKHAAKATATTAAAGDAKRVRTSNPPNPPFHRHFKVSMDPGAATYKIGDTKVWNDETWYYCDYPNHRNRSRWHTHSAAACRTRTAWLAEKKNKPAANAADVDAPATTVPAAAGSSSSSSTSSTLTTSVSPDLTALLATALGLASDSVTKDIIAEALNSLSN